MYFYLKKFRAYSLSEVLIVMVITGVIMSMSYALINQVQIQVSRVKELQVQRQEMNLFRNVFTHHFHNNRVYRLSAEEFIFHSESKNIYLQIFQDSVLLDLHSYPVSIEIHDVRSSGFEIQDDEITEIDAIKGVYYVNDRPIPFFIYKELDYKSTLNAYGL